MQEELKKIKDKILAEIKDVQIETEFQKLEKKYLGRKGELTRLLKGVKDLAEEQRPVIGKLANEVKTELEDAFLKLKNKINQKGGDFLESITNFDPSLQAQKRSIGHLHPNTLVQNKVVDIFRSMGFMVLDGPELESDYYNFEALNIPPTHPARDMQDTFFIQQNKSLKNESKLVMRTHTSNQQVRAIEEFGAPLRAVFPGKCFRNEATDASHDNTFYQLEGLMIDKNISIANLISVMNSLLTQVFN